MKTIRFVGWWVLLSLLVSPLGLPIATQANLNWAPSDPFADSYDRVTYRADSGSPAGALLHIKIRWWQIAWANGQGYALDRTDGQGQAIQSLVTWPPTRSSLRPMRWAARPNSSTMRRGT